MISKKFVLVLMLIPAISSAAELQVQDLPPFEHRKEEQYPQGMEFIPVHDVLTTIEPIPDDTKARFEKIVQKQRALLLNIPRKDVPLTAEKETLYISGLEARARTMVSSLGHDPYQKIPDNITADSLTGPVIHHCTIAVSQHILKRLGLKTVKALPSWLYQIDQSCPDLDDRNYLLVQQPIPDNFKQFAKLPEGKKKKFLREMDMDEFYTALKAIHYAFPDENNIYVNLDDHEIMMPRTLSPDNEGLGATAKYGKAILGQDLNKAKHNFRNWYDGGHRTFENVVKTYGDTEEIETWNALYSSDPTFKQN